MTYRMRVGAVRLGLLIGAAGILSFNLNCSAVKFQAAAPIGAVTGKLACINGLKTVTETIFEPCPAEAGLAIGHVTVHRTSQVACGEAAANNSTELISQAVPAKVVETRDSYCHSYPRTRCGDESSFTEAQAIGRLAWIRKCGPQIPELSAFLAITRNGDDLLLGSKPGETANGANTTESVRPTMFPVLTAKNQGVHWIAPTSGSDSCTVPGGLEPIDTVCQPGCYSPEQRIQTDVSGNEREIGDLVTAKEGRTIATVDEGSTLGDIKLRTSAVEYVISSPKAGAETLVVIKTGSGRVLRLTQSHPVVSADGEMHLAGTIREGDELLRADGGVERVTSSTLESFLGQVHNLAPVGNNDDSGGKLVVSEGIVQGSHRHQLEAGRILGRKLLRYRLTDGLFAQDSK